MATIVNPRALRFESPSQGGEALDDPTTYVVELTPEGQTEPTVTVDVAASVATPIDGTQYEIPFTAIPYPPGISFAARIRAANSAGSSAPSSTSADLFRTELEPEPGDLTGTARLTFGNRTYVMTFTYREDASS